MLDYSLLAALAAVLREGSFERAARQLNISPSALSQRIKLLEERVGQVLVRRGPPCVGTAAGLRLARHAEQVDMLEQDLLTELPTLVADVQGRVTLRLAINADSLATWFIAAAADIAAHEPVLLDLSLDDQAHTAERLRNAEVLAAVTALAAPVQGCRSQALGAMRYIATASPSFVRSHFPQGPTAQALAAAPCLSFNRQDQLQTQWVRQTIGAEHGQDLTLPTHWLPASQAFVDAACAGLGWCMNPASLVQEALAAGRLVALGAPLDVPLYWQASRLAPPMLERITARVLAAARATLEPGSAPA